MEEDRISGHQEVDFQGNGDILVQIKISYWNEWRAMCLLHNQRFILRHLNATFKRIRELCGSLGLSKMYVWGNKLH